MRRHLVIRRLAVVLLAIVQMAAPTLASVGDARLLARNDRVASRSHIEDHTRRACAAVAPDDCALCQFLSQHLATRPELPELPSALLDAPGYCGRITAAPTADGRSPTRSRAPPVA